MRHGLVFCFFFLCKQKTAYEMRISDWSSDVCSSDLVASWLARRVILLPLPRAASSSIRRSALRPADEAVRTRPVPSQCGHGRVEASSTPVRRRRSEEHTSELQSIMRISYAVFCLQKTKEHKHSTKNKISPKSNTLIR